VSSLLINPFHPELSEPRVNSNGNIARQVPLALPRGVLGAKLGSVVIAGINDVEDDDTDSNL
jgi:hypothetical protein